jgi:hypothetical protein
MGGMEIACADCGCVVDRGVIVRSCGKSDCCCRHLPKGSSTTTANAKAHT